MSMIWIRIQSMWGTFRNPLARIYAETFPFAPPSTVYGMLLSLVGEYDRSRHHGVRLGFAYKRIPDKMKTIQKMYGMQYGGSSAHEKFSPDIVEFLYDLDCVVLIDSSQESNQDQLEVRVREAIEHPEQVNRDGILYLGASDDLVDAIDLIPGPLEGYQWLMPSNRGRYVLPLSCDFSNCAQATYARFALLDALEPEQSLVQVA